MWARVTEFMLACWLAVSPFIFQHPAERLDLWCTDWAAATLVATFALLSYLRPLGLIHLATAVLAIGLILFGRFSSPGHIEPALQNHIIVGLLLLMFAIVPNYATRPPRAWYLAPDETAERA